MPDDRRAACRAAEKDEVVAYFDDDGEVRVYKLVEHIVPINRGANNIKHVVNK